MKDLEKKKIYNEKKNEKENLISQISQQIWHKNQQLRPLLKKQMELEKLLEFRKKEKKSAEE